MKLTTEVVGRYVGGELEVQNALEGYIHRGVIKTIIVIEVGEAFLMVTLDWVARGLGFPPVPGRYVKYDEVVFCASLEAFDVAEIGEGRLYLSSRFLSENVVLFPPGGSRLDASRVRRPAC